jgi:nucleoside 2-deoxyribosyltransferase
MKIVICGSMSAHREMLEVKKSLEEDGHSIQLPSFNNIDAEIDENGNSKETAHIKIKDDLIRGYYKKIKECDAILVVNPEKRAIPGYIGANTFLEIGFAHVLEKRLYVLNDYSRELPYVDEIDAMQPVVMNNDLSKINNSEILA